MCASNAVDKNYIHSNAQQSCLLYLIFIIDGAKYHSLRREYTLK